MSLQARSAYAQWAAVSDDDLPVLPPPRTHYAQTACILDAVRRYAELPISHIQLRIRALATPASKNLGQRRGLRLCSDGFKLITQRLVAADAAGGSVAALTGFESCSNRTFTKTALAARRPIHIIPPSVGPTWVIRVKG